jgi:multiple sugar transport system substrate-binding protein
VLFRSYGKKLSLDADGNGKLEQAGIYSYNWTTSVYQFGGEFWEQNGSKSRLTDQKVIAGLQWYQDLTYKYHILPKPGEIAGDPFSKGKAGFNLIGPWNFAPLSQSLKFKWEVTNLPVGPTGKSVSELLGQPICMSSRTKHPNEAYQLLRFLTSDPEAQEMQAKLGIAMPSIKKIAYSDVFTKAPSTPQGIMNYLDALEDAYIEPKFTREPKVRQMLTEALQPVFNNQKTVEQVLKTVKPSIDAFLGRK